MEYRALLTALARAEVDFIVVGGVGAVLQGAPIATFDLDVVYSRSRENRTKLTGVLRSLEACYLDRLPDRVEPDEYVLASPLPHLLQTRLGRIDLLGTIHGGLGFEDALQRASFVTIEAGIRVRVLDLAALIEVKEATGRDKDIAQLPVLRRTLEERRKLDQS